MKTLREMMSIVDENAIIKPEQMVQDILSALDNVIEQDFAPEEREEAKAAILDALSKSWFH